MIAVTSTVTIAEEELSFTASRSSGPGGQNVNKVSTKVTVLLDVALTPALSDDERQRVRERLATRINAAGVLRVSSQKERSQSANREAAVARLVELLQEALAEQPPRRPTRKPRAAKERRVTAKKQRGLLKRDRSARFAPED